MSDAALVAIFAGLVVVVLALVIRALLASNKALTHALVARNANELSVLEREPIRTQLSNRLPIPFVRNQPVMDDDDDLLPLGLSG